VANGVKRDLVELQMMVTGETLVVDGDKESVRWSLGESAMGHSARKPFWPVVAVKMAAWVP
jgi:hypothetical protein